MGRQSRSKHARRQLAVRAAEQAMQDPPWTAFAPAITADGSHTASDGQHTYAIWKNSRYTVMTRVIAPADGAHPEVVHLSIRRNDRAPIWCWRDLQAIKNEMVGRECEAIQIFPAESRLVDSSNQFHLYVFTDPDVRIPFGYSERSVTESNAFHAVQEPFEDHVRPADLMPDGMVHQLMREAKRR
jgi:hypothetical protein